MGDFAFWDSIYVVFWLHLHVLEKIIELSIRRFIYVPRPFKTQMFHIAILASKKPDPLS